MSITPPVEFDGNFHIRVNTVKRNRFTRACTKANVDASAVIRALMDDVVKCGIEFNSDTGAPTLKVSRN